MNQPEWKYVCNLGDVSPIEHGGEFLYVDATGIYPPEVEKLIEPEDHLFDTPRAEWMAYRFSIESCTLTDGILSDNKYHPRFPTWFANPYNPDRPQDGPGGLVSLSSFVGMSVDELTGMFLSKDVRVRAMAWLIVGNYHALENLDEYPHRFNAAEVEGRYDAELKLDKIRSNDPKVFRRVLAHHPRGGRVYGYASDIKSGLYSPERIIAESVEDAACFRGMGFPETQVILADQNDPLDPENQTVK